MDSLVSLILLLNDVPHAALLNVLRCSSKIYGYGVSMILRIKQDIINYTQISRVK